MGVTRRKRGGRQIRHHYEFGELRAEFGREFTVGLTFRFHRERVVDDDGGVIVHQCFLGRRDTAAMTHGQSRGIEFVFPCDIRHEVIGRDGNSTTFLRDEFRKGRFPRPRQATDEEEAFHDLHTRRLGEEIPRDGIARPVGVGRVVAQGLEQRRMRRLHVGPRHIAHLLGVHPAPESEREIELGEQNRGRVGLGLGHDDRCLREEENPHLECELLHERDENRNPAEQGEADTVGQRGQSSASHFHYLQSTRGLTDAIYARVKKTGR